MAFGSASFAQDVVTPPAPAGAPAAAATPPAAATPTAAPDPNEITCRYQEITGSYITAKVCHTRREWKQMHQSAEDTLERQRRTGMGQAGGL